MSTTYTIIFQNKRQQAGKYAVFTQPPEISTSAEVYSNVWMSYSVPVNGNFTVNTSVDYYAWVGTSPENPAPGIVVTTGDSALVALGTATAPGTTIPMVVDGGEVSLAIDQETLTALPGAFEIDTGTDFNVPNSRYLIGMGKVNKLGMVAPTASILADNNTQTSISPVVRFYIGVSSYQAGTVVNFSSATKNAADIDFTSSSAKGHFTALVSHEADGSFDVQYVDQVTAAEVFLQKAEKNKASAPLTDSQRLHQLQNQLQALYTLLGNLGLGAPVQGPEVLEWIGQVGWPVAATASIIATGATLIAGYLINQGYSVTYTSVTNPDNTKSTSFKVTKSAGSLLGSGNINTDWTSAVAADQNKDGHQNLGIKVASSTEDVDGSMDWVGQIGWPAVATVAIITTGATLIAGYMVKQGYSVTYTTVSNPDGTKTSTFKVSRNAALLGSGNITTDWNNASAADTNKDGHTNLGIKSASSAVGLIGDGSANGGYPTGGFGNGIQNGGFGNGVQNGGFGNGFGFPTHHEHWIC